MAADVHENNLTPEDRVNGAQQAVIRKALSDLNTIAPDFYAKLSQDDKFDLLSSANKNDPNREDAVRWLLRELAKLQMVVDQATSTTLQKMQERITASESGKGGGLSAAVMRMFQGRR